MDQVKKIGVIGAGMMGSEIALAFAMGGCRVLLKDETLVLASKGKEKISNSLDKHIKKGKLTEEDKNKIIDNVTPVEHCEALKDADFIIEAVFENIEVKKAVFAALDDICRDECIFATNTSSISVTLLSASVKKADGGLSGSAFLFSCFDYETCGSRSGA